MKDGDFLIPQDARGGDAIPVGGSARILPSLQIVTRGQPTSSHDSGPVDCHPLPPLFRWPGGKRWLVPTLQPLISQGVGRYFEPFFGAGALFFATGPSESVVSDANADLMACYRCIRDDHPAVGKILRAMDRDQISYYRFRESSPSEPIAKAARFIYLSSLAFNGIHRVNKSGKFNVPYGGRTYLGLGDDDVLEAYALALSSASILSGDFEVAVSDASAGDFVYLDPPYAVASENGGFVKYNAKIFSWEDQLRLAKVAAELDRRGCVVVVSNAYHPSIESLYLAFQATVVSRSSRIAASKSSRVVREYLFTNGN